MTDGNIHILQRGDAYRARSRLGVRVNNHIQNALVRNHQIRPVTKNQRAAFVGRRAFGQVGRNLV